MPEPVNQVGIAVIGAGAGAMIDGGVLELVISEPLAILGGVVGTLVVSMAVGQLLRLSPHVDGRTAVLASIAGGASGVSAVARELNANEGIVLAVQYLRVLFVIASVPVVAHLFGATESAEVSGHGQQVTASGLVFTVIAVTVGLLLARVLRFSASGLLLPLLVAMALSLGEVSPGATVPGVVLASAYACLGVVVGLSLTRATLRALIRLLPLAITQVAAGVAACALVGLAFSELTGVPRLDAYLATTPGGLPAVTAVAIGSGAGVGLIITMQLVRAVLALVLAPAVGQLFRSRA